MMNVPAPDGPPGSFAYYEEKWSCGTKFPWRIHENAITHVGRAANLLLHMSDVARKVYMTVGKDVVGNIAAAEPISRILRGRFAPGAIDSIFQDTAKVMYFKRTGQKMDTYLMEFNTSGQRAGARLIMGSGFRDEFVSVLRMRNAALTKNAQTLVLASSGNTLASQSVSAQMRRLFGPCGYAPRQDVLVAADMDTAPEEEAFEAWMVYCKVKRAKKDAQGSGEHGRREKSRSPGEGRTQNAINRRTGERNRCYTYNSGYHFAPQCPQREHRYGGASLSPSAGKKAPQ